MTNAEAFSVQGNITMSGVCNPGVFQGCLDGGKQTRFSEDYKFKCYEPFIFIQDTLFWGDGVAGLNSESHICEARALPLSYLTTQLLRLQYSLPISARASMHAGLRLEGPPSATVRCDTRHTLCFSVFIRSSQKRGTQADGSRVKMSLNAWEAGAGGTL